eukprot:scaffold20649_cov113-Isochrysis_galbana.AAC.2
MRPASARASRRSSTAGSTAEVLRAEGAVGPPMSLAPAPTAAARRDAHSPSKRSVRTRKSAIPWNSPAARGAW